MSATVHGASADDQTMQVDGMHVFEGGDGSRKNLNVIDISVQEYTNETSAHSAEVARAGLLLNLVPREGGNRFAGTAYGDYTGHGLVSNNVSDAIKARGLTTTTEVDRIWDFSAALGGPIARDRLWFFSSARDWGANQLPADTFYLYDPTRRAIWSNKYWAANARLTWQATRRNKFNVYHESQGRNLQNFNTSNLVPPETSSLDHNNDIHFTQARWTSPLTSRLLLEAGAYHYHATQFSTFMPSSFMKAWVPDPGPDPRAWPTIELSTGKWLAGTSGSGTDAPGRWYQEVGALSYITGSHAVKLGFTHTNGTYNSIYPPAPPVLRLLNGQPFQVQLRAQPAQAVNRMNHDLGLYGHDQWRVRRVTLSLGVRFDYFNGQVDAQSAGASPWFLPARQSPLIPDVPNWKDLNPRLGFAYDVFGNGKTAIKAGANRYVMGEATNFQVSVNPMGGINFSTESPYQQGAPLGTSDIRTWNDLNHDGIPQLDELGPSTNLNYGTLALPTRPDEKLRSGWGVRGYNWELVGGVQHEIVPALSLTVGYTHRRYGNLVWNRNLAIEPTDFSPFTIVSPLNGETITLYNLSPAKRGLTNNILTFAPDNSRVYNGVDMYVNGRFGRGGTVIGGLTVERTVRDNCTIYDPNALRFCKITPPLMAGNQYKVLASYPLPYGIQLSGDFRSIPGPLIMANYTVSSAIAGIPLTLGSLSVNLVEPGSLYGDRLNQLDIRLAKSVRIGPRRFEPYVDFLNALNASPVVSLNTTYGSAWQRPTTILVGRMIKFGMQVHF